MPRSGLVGGAAPRPKGKNAQHDHARTDCKGQHIALANSEAGLADPGGIDPHASSLDEFRGQTAGLDEAGLPQPFVDPQLGALRIH